jgi:hypothetical protein
MRHIARLMAFAASRRQLRHRAFVQIPARDYPLQALLSVGEISMHLNVRTMIEPQYGQAVPEKIVVRCPQRREIETVIGPLVQTCEKFRDGLRLYGVAFGHFDELQERIEAAVTIAGADLRCTLRWRLAAVRVRKNSVMMCWNASRRCSGTSLVIRCVFGRGGIFMVLPCLYGAGGFDLIPVVGDRRGDAGRHRCIEGFGQRKP